MNIWVGDQREFFPPRIEFVLGEGPRSASVEAAAIAIDTQADVEHLLLGLCAPDAGLRAKTAMRRGRVTFRLMVLGIPLTIGLGTLTAVLLLPVLPMWEAV